MNEENKYLLAFNQIAEVGPKRLKKIIDYFPSYQAAWQAGRHELNEAGLDEKTIRAITTRTKKINPDAEWEKIINANVKITTIFDNDYPVLLREIYAAPIILYYQGNFDLTNEFCLAVVGTRKISPYGKQAACRLAGELTTAGLCLVSGLALGIDALTHQTALNTGGKTIAVLGSGLNFIFPKTNYFLAQEIIEKNGAIVSEFPLDCPAYKTNFPRRNRIISGLSLGTLVIEAGLKSGALITAKYALEQNREVFAVPGNIFQENSIGTNFLIQQGARLVSQSNDILEALNLIDAQEIKKIKKILPENEYEKIIYSILNGEGVHIDKIAKSARLDIAVVNSTLAIMEMKGLILNLGDNRYLKAR